MTDDIENQAEAAALFRRAVGTVRPVRHDGIDPVRRRRPPVPASTRADEQAVLAEMASAEFDPAELETGDELLHRAAGLQERQFRRLRRGQFAVEAELDLHGLTAELANEAVARFLNQARGTGKRCVRIVHGKGRRSPDGRPVLKSRLQRWLRQRGDVMGFCSARPVDGGTGAIYVLLRRSK